MLSRGDELNNGVTSAVGTSFHFVALRNLVAVGA